ncbi:hypothetical protein AB0C02_32310 [Micromonospora sp. NPDC048999]|uniref:hypothetical protein n=1 Tax=Micromonospora sp. NPDC048999 TaxID=3155391 RepID=UPI0033EE3223
MTDLRERGSLGLLALLVLNQREPGDLRERRHRLGIFGFAVQEVGLPRNPLDLLDPQGALVQVDVRPAQPDQFTRDERPIAAATA